MGYEANADDARNRAADPISKAEGIPLDEARAQAILGFLALVSRGGHPWFGGVYADARPGHRRF
ncbi:hypothetical protein [Pararhizobium sp. PWRC1-1]|uniref:hypothetical protein n=1 Tax=Pararhizobium sp. PWRC1-1 TaxID=2804566 RepID=UPI003CED137D